MILLSTGAAEPVDNVFPGRAHATMQAQPGPAQAGGFRHTRSHLANAGQCAFVTPAAIINHIAVANVRAAFARTNRQIADWIKRGKKAGNDGLNVVASTSRANSSKISAHPALP